MNDFKYNRELVNWREYPSRLSARFYQLTLELYQTPGWA